MAEELAKVDWQHRHLHTDAQGEPCSCKHVHQVDLIRMSNKSKRLKRTHPKTVHHK